jgi:hypothetical protein
MFRIVNDAWFDARNRRRSLLKAKIRARGAHNGVELANETALDKVTVKSDITMGIRKLHGRNALTLRFPITQSLPNLRSKYPLLLVLKITIC